MTQLREVFCLGDLRIDLGQQTVRRDSVEIPLPKLSFDVLTALARAAPNLISIEELMSEVWPGLVVNPETVIQRVKLLRDALGDNPRSPTYVMGLRGRGYKLLLEPTFLPEPSVEPLVQAAPARIERNDPADRLELPDRPSQPNRAPRFGGRWRSVAALALLLSAVALAVVLTSRPRTRKEAAAAPSIAVLPFLDMSRDKDQEYFSDGISEELIDLLSKVPHLKVPARTSSFYFKGKQATIADIAKALGVTHVLEGSVRASGSTLRVTVQLIRADTGYHVWSQTYQRTLGDVFKVQDEIAGAVLKELKTSLLLEREPRTAPTENAAAYTLYLQAKALFQRGDPAAYEEALARLEQALALDPKFASAWSERAWIKVRQFRIGAILLEKASVEAHAAIAKALELAPNQADVHLTHGRVLYVFDWHWAEAQAEFSRAMALDPGNSDVYQWAGMVEATLGNVDVADTYFKRAEALDPLSPHAYSLSAMLNIRAAQWQEALNNGLRAHILMPAMYGESYQANVDLARGQPQAALAAIANLPVTASSYFRIWALQLSGHKAEASAALAQFENVSGDEAAYAIAQLHALLDEDDAAFAWLDRAYRIHDLDLSFIKGDPALKNIVNDPRFGAFMHRMGL